MLLDPHSITTFARFVYSHASPSLGRIVIYRFTKSKTVTQWWAYINRRVIKKSEIHSNE